MLLFALYSYKITKWQQQLLTVVLHAAGTGAALLRMLGAEVLTVAPSLLSASRRCPGGGTVRGILRFRCIFLALLSSAELHGALAAGCRSHSLLPCAQPTSFSVV